MSTILVGTRRGMHRFDERGRAGDVQFGDRSVTFLAPSGTEVWAVLEGSELWHDAGTGWRRVADLDGLGATCLAAMKGELFVGSAQARLFRLDGETLEAVDGFDQAEGRSEWYTPWGGPPDTRSMTEWDDDLYVNVHVGGILRSNDRGETWTPTIDIDEDVHQVTTAEGMVLAACAGGLAESIDRGATWSLRTDGLEARYARAVAVCGASVLLTTSSGPRGGKAAVYRARLSGGTFRRCVTGIGWFDDNIDSHCLDALPDGSLAAFGTTAGQLFVSTDEGATWDERAAGLAPVQRVLVMP